MTAPGTTSRHRAASGLAVRSIAAVAEAQPGDRVPAPMNLALVQAFVNTFWDLERSCWEQLATPAALRDWLVAHELLHPGVRLGPSDLERALRVREGLRTMLYANNGIEPNERLVADLNQALGAPVLFVELSPSTPPDFKSLGRDFDSALAVLGTIVALAQLDGSWVRLKACPGMECGWAFYDYSRNQTSHWCSMSICGGREKAREYRRRRRRG